jgi:hypothetical protein
MATGVSNILNATDQKPRTFAFSCCSCSLIRFTE